MATRRNRPAPRPTSRPGTTGTLTRSVTQDDRPAATDPILATPGRVITDPGAILPVWTTDHATSLFTTDRPGTPVVRPDDLLALRIERWNLKITPGDPPLLEREIPGRPARLIVHFPPQSIAEQTFFQTAPPDTTNPPAPKPPAPEPDPTDGTEELTPPPVRARIAGESRLVVEVPPDTTIAYTLEGVLQALTTLPLALPANALPRAAAATTRPVVLDMTTVLQADAVHLAPAQRAALASFTLRNLRLGATADGSAALALRVAAGGAGLRTLSQAERAELSRAGGALSLPGAGPVEKLPRIPLPRGPAPTPPGVRDTAIELPWHLIIAPHAGTRWRHALAPVTAPTGHTELWHTRLVAPQDGSEIEPPLADRNRTLRAVWALPDRQGANQPLGSDWPTSLPSPTKWAFRMPLTDFDRYQFVHLSSNFSLSNYTPEPIDANLLMLSALGGWLDTRGAWEPPPGTSIEEWVHHGSMGRDHYVRVVYKGFLFPFGHRVSLIKVSERKFHNGAVKLEDGEPVKVVPELAGNVAYLRQRLFIVIRERERDYADPQLRSNDQKIRLAHQFPFTRVRILTLRTPDLDTPESPTSRIPKNASDPFGQLLFWPCVNGAPFEFDCVATDLDGRRVAFSLPMIFMDNTMAAPAMPNSNPLKPDFDKAWKNAKAARDAWQDTTRSARRRAALQRQRVALAPSTRPTDTSARIDWIEFDGFVDKARNSTLESYSQGLSRPVFYPAVERARLRIAALEQLGGSQAGNTVHYNPIYLQRGFSPDHNQGQVFLDVEQEAGMAQLDFSMQGDRSGGFVQPNLRPSGLSRLSGPVTGNVTSFAQGSMSGADAFPSTTSGLPLPLIFGCIPLGELIQAVSGLAGKPEQVPKFVSEGGNQIEAFIATLGRLFDFVSRLATDPGSLAQAAVDAAMSTLNDLLAQALAYAESLIGPVMTRLNELKAVLQQLRDALDKLTSASFDGDSLPDLTSLDGIVVTVQAAVDGLRSTANAQVAGVSLPAGLRQSLLQAAGVIELLLVDLLKLAELLANGKAVYDALHAIVGGADSLEDLVKNGELGTAIGNVSDALGDLEGTLKGMRLLEGAPRTVILGAIDAVRQVLGMAEDVAKLVEMLAGDELTLRFDWQPPINNWGLSGPQPPPPDKALFRANDKRGFLVAVEARLKKNGDSDPRIQVVCSLRKFDLVLIAPASFIELNFDKIEFRVDTDAKMNVDVLLDDIKFVGPLSFVETLRDLIPLDGFSDPPYLDVSPQGIAAGFDMTLPAVAVGVFNLSNLSLGAGFTVPFIGQPLSVHFHFCTREQPFNLSVCMFGGGGFFGITLDPSGIQLLEAAFEFGASLSMNFGVASGGVKVVAGIYFRMEQDACSLTGYFQLGGYVSVLGLITASLELYLELHYEFESGKCVGTAQLTIEIDVFLFSGSVTITCRKRFAGSNGDPGFRDLLGLAPELPLEQELALIDESTHYAWREYAEAFA